MDLIKLVTDATVGVAKAAVDVVTYVPGTFSPLLTVYPIVNLVFMVPKIWIN